MATNRGYSGMSDLEREIELEMDDELEAVGDDENQSIELEADDGEVDDEWEESSDREAEEEADDDREMQFAEDRPQQEYVERFLEIASRQFESESEVDQALNETLDDIAREHLFGSVLRKARSLGSRLAKNAAIRSLVSKGLSVASGQLPALKAALQLAKGDLQGSLKNLAKQALATAIPGAPAALSALNTLGFSAGAEGAESNREGWENFVQLSGEAFEHLANNLTPNADQPLEASRLANGAYRQAVQRAQGRVSSLIQARPVARAGGRTGMRGGTGRHVVRHHLRPGQTIVITGAARLIVKGGN